MPGEIDHIAELQKRLYTRNEETLPEKKYGILRPIKHNVSSAWGDTTIPKDKGPRKISVTGYKRFFFFSFLFFLVGLGLAGFSVFRGALTLSSKNVDLTVLGNSFVAGGEELPIQVEIANKNSSDLVDATLTLEYPKGATDASGSEVTRLTEVLGTIGSGKTRSVAFSVLLYGEQGLSRTITATLSYHLAGSTATFEKSQTFAVMISSSPIALTVDGPSVSAADQPFALTVRSVFSGDQAFDNGIIRVEYPSGFTFLSATPAPSAGTNVWALGNLEKGNERVITVRGRLSGIEGDEKAFRVYLGTPVSATDNRINVSYNSALHTLAIEQPFIAAEVNVNDSSNDVVALPIGSAISGRVTWRNMTDYSIVNPTFSLVLAGESFDPLSGKAAQGYYDAQQRTFTWTGTSSEELAVIDPGESGTLTFSVSPTNEDAKEDVTMALSIEGAFPDFQNEVKTVANIDELTVRYAARLQFAAQSLYSIGPIKNSGPYPPKANQETSYTITWTARPTENPLSSMVATAILPTNVTWAGVIMPQSEALSYNADMREVRWNIGALPKATATPLSKSVSFQVRARPTTGQVGSEIVLLSETTVGGNDAVANIALSVTRPQLSTKLSTDPIYSPGDEKVVP